jgi:hypothetical protein
VERFKGKLESAGGGGHFVAIPIPTAEKVGLRHGVRVRGTVNDVAYRSSLMKSGDHFCVGVHKATLQKANVEVGQRIDVEIEIDDAPLPTDAAPDDLAQALAKHDAAPAAWKALAPSRRREHVQHILDAKKPATRARRIESIVESLVKRR